MSYMFAYTNAEIIDLSDYWFPSIENINAEYMFAYSDKLKTIYFDTDDFHATNTNNMFLGCTSLVGDVGTVYDSNNVNGNYAKIDKIVNGPGYFSFYVYLKNNVVGVDADLQLSYFTKHAEFTVQSYEIYSGDEYITLDTNKGIVHGVKNGTAAIKTTVKMGNQKLVEIYDYIYVE